MRSLPVRAHGSSLACVRGCSDSSDRAIDRLGGNPSFINMCVASLKLDKSMAARVSAGAWQ